MAEDSFAPLDLPAIVQTRSDLDEIRKIESLKPTREDTKKIFRRNGRYHENDKGEWKIEFQANHQGTLTREAREFYEAMLPATRAQQERMQRLNGRYERERLVDHRGEVRTMRVGQAEQVAKKNGWRPVVRLGRGAPVEWGPTGMAFRWLHGWMPTGKARLGISEPDLPLEGYHIDPDGGMWVPHEGEWVKPTGVALAGE